MHRTITLIILAYYKMAPTNADRVYNPFDPAPHDPHTWSLPTVTS